MKVIKLIMIVVILNSAFLILDCLAKGAGSSAVATLTQPVSARAAGMAEAYTAVSGEVVSMHYNPAGLANLKGMDLSTMYQRGMDEDNLAYIGFAKKYSFATLGANIMYYDTGKIELYDLAGNEISKVGQRDIIVTVGVGRTIYNDMIALGLNIKGISSEIFGEKASAVAADIGAQYHSIVDVGFAIQNMGTSISYAEEDESLPQIVRLGVSYTHELARNRITAALDIPYLINEEETTGLIGLEYTYDNLFSLRGGYVINFTDASRDDEQNITAGVGFIWQSLSFDYAIGITENLDNPHHVSISMKF